MLMQSASSSTTRGRSSRESGVSSERLSNGRASAFGISGERSAAEIVRAIVDSTSDEASCFPVGSTGRDRQLEQRPAGAFAGNSAPQLGHRVASAAMAKILGHHVGPDRSAVARKSERETASRQHVLSQNICFVESRRFTGAPWLNVPQWSVSLDFIWTLSCSGRSATTRLSHSGE